MCNRIFGAALLGVLLTALAFACGCRGGQGSSAGDAQAQGKAFGMKQAEFMKQKMQGGGMPGARTQGGPAGR